jgi:hypothetical protein
MRQPCNECPYRKDSAPGYLGSESYNPNAFLTQLELELLHPCHMTVDWEADDESQVLEAPICAGALQFAKNICKMLQPYPESLRKELKVDDSIVFGTRHEFVSHHSNQ